MPSRAKGDEVEFNDDYGGYSAKEPSGELWRRDRIWFECIHPIERPPVPTYNLRELQLKDVDLNSSFFNHADRIQVIMKLANTHLTPKTPMYNSRS
ncbi:hypothetical protein CGLO_08494 [Colletotrichum gloeosporioides Cg-14]|uniref:DUF4246 domain-containing protein n=1 Tax=Colletotrichum gloeosporioides (strain Cg-14) TaxID=1237896 RepID=T0KI76_COLGC|nr:hypothetical protein CGLO_08494 [Colletotrichum gloeosporioides Cg-14]